MILGWVALVAAEAATTSAFAARFGWGWTLIWMVAAVFLGASLMSTARNRAVLRMQVIGNRGGRAAALGDLAAETIVTVIGAALLVLPGILSDLAAVFCLVPGLRLLPIWLVRRWVGRSVEAAASAPGSATWFASTTTVVDGVVVTDTVVGTTGPVPDDSLTPRPLIAGEGWDRSPGLGGDVIDGSVVDSRDDDPDADPPRTG